MSITLERAIALAAEAHAGQTDRGGAPYILHPLRVMLRQTTITAMVVAVFHDVLEDCPEWGVDRLRSAGFPEEMVSALDALTKRPGEDYETFVGRLAQDRIARAVKLADLRDNMDLSRLGKVSPADLARVEKYKRAEAVIKAADVKPKPVDCLTLPNGHRLTRDELRRARNSLPPIVPMRLTGAPGQLWQHRDVRIFPVLDASGEIVGEVWFMWKERGWHIGRTDFISSFEERLRSDDGGRLMVAAEDKDWATLDGFDPELLPWYCRSCGCNYAESEWTVSQEFEEDGWPDCHRGRCPKGHLRMVAD